ncbi:hypothetical protein IWZ00DRAFT_486539 [Phyllosticta capitalensis]
MSIDAKPNSTPTRGPLPPLRKSTWSTEAIVSIVGVVLVVLVPLCAFILKQVFSRMTARSSYNRIDVEFQNVGHLCIHQRHQSNVETDDTRGTTSIDASSWQFNERQNRSSPVHECANRGRVSETPSGSGVFDQVSNQITADHPAIDNLGVPSSDPSHSLDGIQPMAVIDGAARTPLEDHPMGAYSQQRNPFLSQTLVHLVLRQIFQNSTGLALPD